MAKGIFGIGKKAPHEETSDLVPPHITALAAEGLFGQQNHEIKLDNKEVSILIGPNGCGKTTILRILQYFFSRRLTLLRNVDFKLFTISFSSGEQVRIEKKENLPDDKKPNEKSKSYLIITLHLRGKELEKFDTSKLADSDLAAKIPFASIDDIVPNLQRVSRDEWRDYKTGAVYDIGEIMLSFNYSNSESDRSWGKWINDFVTKRIPKRILEIIESQPIHFIETQRLLQFAEHEREKTTRVSEKIEIFSAEISKLLSNKLADSAKSSQLLDRSFPLRLLKRRGQRHEITETALREKYNKIEERRKRLMAVGLLEEADDIAELPKSNLDPNDIPVLDLYLEDTKEKLDVFSDLQEKIEAFKEIINAKFNPFKELHVSPKTGFVVKFWLRKGDFAPQRLVIWRTTSDCPSVQPNISDSQWSFIVN